MIYLKYSGTIKDRRKIRQLQEEFIDICRISGWKHEIVTENFQTLTMKGKASGKRKAEEDEFDDELKTVASSEVYLDGIIINTGDGADPLKFTFDRNGRISTINFCTTDTIGVSGKLTVKKFEFIYYPYIKVLTPDPEKHRRTVRILEHIKKSYIPDLRVIDTSFYWNSKDEEELKVRFWKSFRGKNAIR